METNKTYISNNIKNDDEELFVDSEASSSSVATITAELEKTLLAENPVSPCASDSMSNMDAEMDAKVGTGALPGKKRKRICGAERKRRRRAKILEGSGHEANLSAAHAGSSTKRARSDGSSDLYSPAPQRKKADESSGISAAAEAAPIPSTSGSVSNSATPPESSRKSTSDATNRDRRAASYKQAASCALEVHIRDATDEDVSNDKCELIQDALLGKILGTTGAAPKFEGLALRGGSVVIRCQDEATQNWLIVTVNTMKPWKDAVLVATRACDLPKRVKARMWVPGKLRDGKDILGCLDVQNPGLDVRRWKWKILSTGDKDPTPDQRGHLCYLEIDERSIPFLKQRGFRVDLFFSRTKIFLVKRGEGRTNGPPT